MTDTFEISISSYALSERLHPDLIKELIGKAIEERFKGEQECATFHIETRRIHRFDEVNASPVLWMYTAVNLFCRFCGAKDCTKNCAAYTVPGPPPSIFKFYPCCGAPANRKPMEGAKPHAAGCDFEAQRQSFARANVGNRNTRAVAEQKVAE